MTTEDVKEELIHQECKNECCAKAELCAAIMLSSGISFRGFGKFAITLSSTRASVTRYYFMLAKSFFGITAEIRITRSNRLGGSTHYDLSFPEESVSGLLELLKISNPDSLFGLRSTPAKEILQSPCCQAAFLKSAFLVSGSIADPERAYDLRIMCSGAEMASSVSNVMNFKGIKACYNPIRTHMVAYTKDFDSVRTFLAVTGAHSAVLKMDDLRIMKDLKNNANRQWNCDNNNIERTVQSARKQLDDIMYLQSQIGLDKLPDWAREIASLRLDNPATPLSELGELCDPKLGKSGVSKRLQRLSELAQKIREGNE